VTGLAFSADGTRLASAVEEPVLQVDEDGLAQRQPAAPSVLLWNLDLASVEHGGMRGRRPQSQQSRMDALRRP
jgi:hypothetical protein